MTKNATMTAAGAVGAMLVDDDGFAPIEDAVRARGRGGIATILEEELDASAPRYRRRKAEPAGSIDAAAPLPARSSPAHARACP